MHYSLPATRSEYPCSRKRPLNSYLMVVLATCCCAAVLTTAFLTNTSMDETSGEDLGSAASRLTARHTRPLPPHLQNPRYSHNHNLLSTEPYSQRSNSRDPRYRYPNHAGMTARGYHYNARSQHVARSALSSAGSSSSCTHKDLINRLGSLGVEESLSRSDSMKLRVKASVDEKEKTESRMSEEELLRELEKSNFKKQKVKRKKRRSSSTSAATEEGKKKRVPRKGEMAPWEEGQLFPEGFEEMDINTKISNLYMGKRGLLFWLNKISLFVAGGVIVGWIFFRFVGPSLGLYKLANGFDPATFTDIAQ